MINQPQPNVAQPSIPIPVQPARILLGWMSEQDGALWLAGRRTDLQNNPEYIERSRLARNAVASRKAGLDQGEVIHKPSEALAPYIASFSQDPVGQHFINEGWRVVIADLTKVCAVQPHVLTNSARQRVSTLASFDELSLAQFCLPMAAPNPVPMQFDPSKNVFIFSSRNPNLRITGNIQSTVQPGVMGMGFCSCRDAILHAGCTLLRAIHPSRWIPPRIWSPRIRHQAGSRSLQRVRYFDRTLPKSWSLLPRRVLKRTASYHSGLLR